MAHYETSLDPLNLTSFRFMCEGMKIIIVFKSVVEASH